MPSEMKPHLTAWTRKRYATFRVFFRNWLSHSLRLPFPVRCSLLPRVFRVFVARRADYSYFFIIPGAILLYLNAAIRFCHGAPLSSLLRNHDLILLVPAILWLGFASHLIHVAVRAFDNFEKQCRRLFNLDTRRITELHCLRRQLLKPQGHLLLTICFFLPLTAILIVIALYAPDAQLGLVAVLYPCFYYAGFGQWGSILCTRAVPVVCRQIRPQLDVFHPDGLAGLDFLRRYTDFTSALLFTGILLVPIGSQLTIATLRIADIDHNVLAFFTFGFAVIALASWIVFTAMAILRGRAAIYWTLREFRQDTLMTIAEDRRRLAQSGVISPPARNHRVEQELAARNLRIDFLIQSGAWREFAGAIVAALLALVSSAITTHFFS